MGVMERRMPSGEPAGNERSEGATDWSDNLSYGGDTEVAVPEHGGESEHWSRWHYGIYLGAALLLVGAVKVSLVFLLPGYLLVPIAMHLDSRYVESVTPRWQRDTGLYIIGSLLFPVVMIPMYLYRRRELRSTG